MQVARWAHMHHFLAVTGRAHCQRQVVFLIDLYEGSSGNMPRKKHFFDFHICLKRIYILS